MRYLKYFQILIQLLINNFLSQIFANTNLICLNFYLLLTFLIILKLFCDFITQINKGRMIYKSKQIKSKLSPRQRSNTKTITVTKDNNRQSKVIQKTKQKTSKTNILIDKRPICKSINQNPENSKKNTRQITRFKTQTYVGPYNNAKISDQKYESNNVASMTEMKSLHYTQDIQQVHNHFVLQNSEPLSINNQLSQHQLSQKQIDLKNANSKLTKKHKKSQKQIQNIMALLQKKDQQIQNITKVIVRLKYQNQSIKQTYQTFYNWKQIVYSKIRKQINEIAEKFQKQRNQFLQKLTNSVKQNNLKQQQQNFIKKGLRQSFLKGIYKMNIQALQIIDEIDKEEERMSYNFKNGLFTSNSLQQLKSIKIQYNNKVLPKIGYQQMCFNTKNINQIVLSPNNNQKDFMIRSKSFHPFTEKKSANKVKACKRKINSRNSQQI